MAIESRETISAPTVSASTRLGNDIGVYLDHAHHNIIGGLRPQASNVIAGNKLGVALGVIEGFEGQISGATFNVVFGNDIGLNTRGEGLGNTVGVQLAGPDVKFNVIGGDTFEGRNVISGNTSSGVQIVNGANFNFVQGNFVGTDSLGVARQRHWCVHRIGPHDNVVGGSVAGTRNIISGNNYGVVIEGEGTTNNHLRGNYIGTDQSGAALLDDDKSNFVGVLVGIGHRRQFHWGTSRRLAEYYLWQSDWGGDRG